MAKAGAIRAALVERWYRLTRQLLPAMADSQHWPIRLDHCFMRVCLDTSLGQRWDRAVRRPAIRYLSLQQLAAAVAQAERIMATPSILPSLNRDSLRLRAVRQCR